MRVVIFVAVVAAHVIVFFLLSSWRRERVPEVKNEFPITLVYLPPLLSEPTSQQLWQAPLLYRSGAKRGPAASQTRNQRAPPGPVSERSSGDLPVATSPAGTEVAITPPPIQTPPDWHAQAQALAEQDARQIVTAEDAAESRAKALTSRFRPLPPPPARSPGFAWDYAPTHRIAPLPQGGFVYSINDNCQILILPLPFIGCALGKSPANGALFKNLHPPLQYGDWDWRVRDP
jgi:hypothetical protein